MLELYIKDISNEYNILLDKITVFINRHSNGIVNSNTLPNILSSTLNSRLPSDIHAITLDINDDNILRNNNNVITDVPNTRYINHRHRLSTINIENMDNKSEVYMSNYYLDHFHQCFEAECTYVNNCTKGGISILWVSNADAKLIQAIISRLYTCTLSKKVLDGLYLVFSITYSSLDTEVIISDTSNIPRYTFDSAFDYLDNSSL